MDTEKQRQPNFDIKIEKQDNNGEIMLHRGMASWNKGYSSRLNGFGTLTNKRFIFTMPPIAKIISIGVSKVFKQFAEGGIEIEIPYDRIKNISQGKYLLGKILVIETKDGLIYKFAVMNYNKWANIISKYIS
jgi:hypothetical protein